MLRLATALVLSGNFWAAHPLSSAFLTRHEQGGRSHSLLAGRLGARYRWYGLSCLGVSIERDTYRSPFKSGRARQGISSSFGLRFHPILKYVWFHDGWDLPRPYGTPVYPSRGGRVVFAGWAGGYGRLVKIRHSDRSTTWYGHLSSIRVKTGQWVRQGRLIGRVGSSGLSTGPHLHFEIRDARGVPIDPYREIGKFGYSGYREWL